jgi:hypothetical protein
MAGKSLMHVKLTFVEPILGSAPSNPDIYKEYIASKAPAEKDTTDEIESLPADEMDKGVTVFHKLSDGRSCIMDHQIKGFFKNACSAMRDVPKSESSKIKAYKKKIDLNIFIKQRKIKFIDASDITIFQRPLRADTPQGPRTALSASERIEAGAKLEFDIEILVPDYYPVVCEWLDYGKYNGLGQWHNGSMGRFLWEELDDEGNKIAGNISEIDTYGK